MTTLKPMTADQEVLLSAWRAGALEKMPYMASMLFSLRPLDAPGLGTFAVDAQHRCYIDFEAVAAKGPRWCSEALLHECGHLFGEHHARAKDMVVTEAEQDLSNLASDAEINDDLEDAGCDMADAVLPERIGQERYRTYEEYLTALRKRTQSSKPKPDQGSGQGSGDEPSPGQSAGQGADPFNGCGSGSGGKKAPCELGELDGLGGAAPPASASERARTLVATSAAIRDHAKSRGNVPAGLVDRAEMVLAPAKIPWRRVLSASVRRALGAKLGDFDITYSRRNRRSHGSRFVMPGTYTPTPMLAAVRDTSGSMSMDDLAVASSEVVGIAKQLGIRGRDLRVLDCDAVVHAIADYTGPTGLETVAGRGGTSMVVGIERAMELRPRPNAVVVLTDGYTPWPDAPIGVPLIACIISPEGAGRTPPWVTEVVVDDLGD